MKKIANNITRVAGIAKQLATRYGILPSQMRLGGVLPRVLPSSSDIALRQFPGITGDNLSRFKSLFDKLPAVRKQAILKALFNKFIGSIDDTTGALITYPNGRKSIGGYDRFTVMRTGAASKAKGLVAKLLAMQSSGSLLPNIKDDVVPNFGRPGSNGGTTYMGALTPPPTIKLNPLGVVYSYGELARGALPGGGVQREAAIRALMRQVYRGGEPWKLQQVDAGYRKDRAGINWRGDDGNEVQVAKFKRPNTYGYTPMRDGDTGIGRKHVDALPVDE